ASAALARDVAKFWSGTTEKSNPEKLTFTETGSVTTVLLSSDEQENRCATNKGSNKIRNFFIFYRIFCYNAVKLRFIFIRSTKKLLKKYKSSIDLTKNG
ncbi:MAG: hypothetical protein KIG80_03495, partial [Prevotella sp.]|nr:hypothetical protein [Prevotella sp.]